MKQETVILNVLANMTGPEMYELSRKLAWYAPAASEEFEFNLALNNRERIEQAKKEAELQMRKEFFVEKLNLVA
jgi:Holliday junction resolvase RusA-like endonuclease